MRIFSCSVIAQTVALGIILSTLCVCAEAQQPAKVYRIGVLTNLPPTAPEALRFWGAFRQELRDRGWIEKQNFVIEYRWAEGQVERFPSLATELLAQKIDVMVAVSTPGARAAKKAIGSVPIVMVYTADPVEEGLIASLARPGGNLTGLTFVVSPEILGKYLGLLKEAVSASPAWQFSCLKAPNRFSSPRRRLQQRFWG